MTATILIVDDVEASRREMARMVESLGFRAVGAGSGMDGLRIVREERPSLVLLDLVLPDFDGFKMAAMIKALPFFTPVLMVTGSDDLESRRRGQAAGADDFLGKPVHPLELQIRIQAMLRIKQLTDELNAANRRLADLAETDTLTGIANRRRFDAMAEREHDRAQRYRRALSALMIDIDHFKKVNDAHGHPVGDDVLRSVARALAETIRGSDHVGRLGGEEFAVLAPEVAEAGALGLAERLRRRVEALQLSTEAGSFSVTISIGCASWDGQSELPMAALLARADAALYQAKESGRNRSLVWKG